MVPKATQFESRLHASAQCAVVLPEIERRTL